MRRILLATLILVACNKVETPVRDAATEPMALDATPAPGDAPVSLAVDFAVEGCPDFDSQALTCTGQAPLTLRFVPLSTTTVTKYLWSFGDATSLDSEVAPSHVYTTPGTYTVQIVATGVGGGVVTKSHVGFVVAQANGAGLSCSSDQQCAAGLFCLCGAGTSCIGGPSQGMCASSCQTGSCADGLICAGLLTATPPSGTAAPWQAPLCLPTCSQDADCAAGLRCRTVPPGPGSSAWVRVCFADVPADVGGSCIDTGGHLRNDLCASGLCVGLGAKGECSMNCQLTSCPQGSICAAMGDGRRLCLRPCTGGFNCDQDPLLTCVVPGPGDLGFSLVSPTTATSAASYCAPKPCVSDDPCLPTGTCLGQSSGGHCAPRTD
jgi:hypothetical protein